MMAMNVRVAWDSATPAIDFVRRGLSESEVMPYFAEAVTQSVQENFMGLEATRANKLGGERSHYFAQAADHTTWRQEGDNRVIIATQQVGLVMKYFGGTVAAGKNDSCWTGQTTKKLAIPAIASAVGHRPCDFDVLKVLFGKNGPYALGRVEVHSVATGGASTRTHEIVYWLRSEVEIPTDATILPSQLRIQAVLQLTFTDYVNLLWENAQKYAPRVRTMSAGGTN